MRRLLAAGFVVIAAGLCLPATTYAQQTITFSLGGFRPTGAEGRFDNGGDVLVNNQDFLLFDIGQFHGFTFNADYTVPLGRFFDAGLGVGYYQQTVPAIYADFEDTNGRDIQQDLRLRITPFTATIRFLPFGRQHGIEPYVGGGLGIFNYHYSEAGDFIDFNDNSIFTDKFVGSGTATGPVILGGVRIPIGPLGFGGEVRWQSADGDLPASEEFSSDHIELGGWTYLATFHVRF